MLDRRVPYDLLRVGRNDRADADISIELVTGRGLLLLQSTSESRLQEALTNEIGVSLPGPQWVSVLRGYALLGLTPWEWLLEHPETETDALQAAFTARLASSLAAVVDMTDAFAYLEISGDRASDGLMTGCSLDLRAHAFPASSVARTALADVPAIIWNPGAPDRYRCLVDRSVSVHLWNWLHHLAWQ